MKGINFVIAGMLISSMALAQKNQAMTGEYYLRGVMETASGFRLNPDSTFDFFFSQGALDRGGSGRWTVKDGAIIFNSRKRPARDFALLESKTIPGDSITVQIKDENTVMLRYVECYIKAVSGTLNSRTNEEGVATFAAKNAESISLLFRLCPDRPSVFSIDNKQHNYFSFRFEPWIAEVFFENFTLQLSGEGMTGGHPLLQGKKFTYEKN